MIVYISHIFVYHTIIFRNVFACFLLERFTPLGPPAPYFWGQKDLPFAAQKNTSNGKRRRFTPMGSEVNKSLMEAAGKLDSEAIKDLLNQGGDETVVGFLRVPGCSRGGATGEPLGFRPGRLGNLREP